MDGLLENDRYGNFVPSMWTGQYLKWFDLHLHDS